MHVLARPNYVVLKNYTEKKDSALIEADETVGPIFVIVPDGKKVLAFSVNAFKLNGETLYWCRDEDIIGDVK